MTRRRPTFLTKLISPALRRSSPVAVGKSRKKSVRRSRRSSLETLEHRRVLAAIYVSDSLGDNANDGSSTSAYLKTIQAGADRAQPGDEVIIRGGVYRETVSVPRSGTQSQPIRFEAWPGEEVVVSGGDLVSAWTLHSGDIWKATVNWNANNNRDNNTLFVNGQLELEAKQFAENDILDVDDWGQIDKGDLTNTTLQSDQLISGTWSSSKWVGATVRHHLKDWIIEERTVTGYNPATGTLTFADNGDVISQKQDFGFYIDDTLETLDKPGEWFKDNGSTLYYQTEPGGDPNNDQIEFKRRGYGFDVGGRDNIEIDGLTFRGVSIDADSNSDSNVYENNVFYGYGKGPSNGFGRMYISGQDNIVRGNEAYQLFGGVLDLDGSGNQIVNNYFHDTNMHGTGGVINSEGAGQLVSYNTVRNFGRSFADGYSLRSEYSYNVFEDGGNLSWDTGVFDSDGGNGNSSQSVFHHNVFRGTDSRGIFEAFYGGNDNTVIHHNLFYDWQQGVPRSPLQTAGINFRQVYHNTVIGNSPKGTLDALDAVATRHNNNLQISLVDMAAIGVDLRGNALYTTADFIDFNGKDFGLAAGSSAINAGIVLSGINDGTRGSTAYSGVAPDAGALEFGQAMWDVGHDFSSPPSPTFNGVNLPGVNLNTNSQFSDNKTQSSAPARLAPWTTESGNPDVADDNSWNIKDANYITEYGQTNDDGKTGSFRTGSVYFDPGEAIRRTFTDLTPDTIYTLGASVRVYQEVVSDGRSYNASSGTVLKNEFRGQGYLYGLASGEWARFDNVDFGAAGQFDQLSVMIRRSDAMDNPANSFAGTTLQVRVGSPTGTLVAEFAGDDITDATSWLTRKQTISGVTGNQTVYVSASGPNSQNLALSEIYLSRKDVLDQDKLTVTISSSGATTQNYPLGESTWQRDYEKILFTTGPSATTATVTFTNDGRGESFLDRMFLLEGDVASAGSEGDIAREFGISQQSSVAAGLGADRMVDGSSATYAETQDAANSWMQVGFAQNLLAGQIELENVDTTNFGRLSNFTVSVWSDDPSDGGQQLWSKAYFPSGNVPQGESLVIPGDEIADDGETRLSSAKGKLFRIQLNGQNNNGDGKLALSSFKLFRATTHPSAKNLAHQSKPIQFSEHYATRSTAVDAINGDGSDFTHNIVGTGQWWHTELRELQPIDQIVLHHGGRAGPLSVSVWSDDPRLGGSVLWTKDLGTVGAEVSVVINGDEVSGGQRLDSLTNARFVRFDATGSNQILQLREVQVWTLADSQGSIMLDRASYSVGSQVNVSVQDSNAGSTVLVTASGLSGSVPITLTKTGIHYTGSFTLVSGPAGPGEFSVQPGSEFTVTYVDQDTGDGSSATLSASAMVTTLIHVESTQIVPIPSNSVGTVQSEIIVSDVGTLADIELEMDISHTWLGDLTVTLVSPANTRIVLANRVGGSSNNFTMTRFSDDASQSISSGSAPYTGTFRPEQNFSSLVGEAIDGTWILEVMDAFNQDGGAINSWSMDFSIQTPSDDDAPSLTSFVRSVPASERTAADAMTFLATFDEQVAGVGTDDFIVGGSSATVTDVTPVQGTGEAVYMVTISGGDLAQLNGTVGLNLAAIGDITDLAGNDLVIDEPAIDETYIVDNVAPTAADIWINDQTSDSRSQITSLTVTFDYVVDHTSLDGAFVVTNETTNVAVGDVSVTATDNAGQTTAVLTFDGTSTDARMGAGPAGNSLSDGVYRLDIIAGSVWRTDTLKAMSANHQFGGDGAAKDIDKFFRLFGDVSGEGDVSLTDFASFRQAFGGGSSDPDYRWDMDLDGDGNVGLADFAAFRTRFGTSV